jgi:Pyruvate/2-oxoacid:ferredoxin oxidoreductase gamma subunit
MLGAMAAAGLVNLEAVTTTILKKFGAKGPANADAARRAYAETRSH